MTRTIYSDELYHHGIKGQKWGVRRYQNEDGSWTEAGRKRYGNYNPSGTMTSKTKKRLKKLAIGAGAVLGTAAAIYVARDIGRNYFDEVIKAGTTIQNLSNDPDRINKGTAWYASFRNSDNNRYESDFGRDLNILGQPVGENKYKTTVEATKDIKIASKRSGEKVFNALMKNNPEFKKMFESMEGSYKELGSANNKYGIFNQVGLIDNQSPKSEKLQRMFYDELKKKGYGGVHDTNDRHYSGYNTKANIMFDNSYFSNKNTRRLTDQEIKTARKKATGKKIADQVMHPGNVATGIGLMALYDLDKRNAKTREIEKMNKQRKKEKEKEERLRK